MSNCTATGCAKPHHSRGYCKTHYNQQLPNRHRAHPTVCAVCDAPIRKQTNKGRAAVCSYECRRRLQFGWSEPLPADHWARWYGATCPWSPPAEPKPERSGWISGICYDCGAPFAAANDGQRHLYCSLPCTKRTARRVRRAREHGAAGTFRYVEVMRLYIANGKRCAYCDQPIDGLPDPEHVLPLSRGGRNDLTNLVAACRRCNADKNDLTLDEWATDRARRGLPALALDLTRPVFRHLVAAEPTGPAWRHALT